MNAYFDIARNMADELGLSDPVFEDIDLYLLLEIYYWKKKTPKVVAKKLINAEIPSADEMEFIGDAVLHIIITNAVAERPLSVGKMSSYRSLIERNSNIFRYANDLELCKADGKNLALKACADKFEAVVGALYLHLFYARGLRYASLDIIEDWLKVFRYEEFLDFLVKTKR